MLDSDGPDLRSPFKEPRECPMMRCVQRRFTTPFDLIKHLRECAETQTGEVRCTSCMACHSTKKKGATHMLLKSPVILLQKHWSVRRNARQHQGRNTGPTMVSTSTQAQETGAAGEMSHPLQSEPQQLHSNSISFELPSVQTHPNSNWGPMPAPAGESEKQSWTQAPVYNQVDEAFRFQNATHAPFAPSFPHQPSTQPSWSENSQRSTLFEASSLQGKGKQLSTDMVSLQSSSGSYHGSQYSQAAPQNQIMIPTSSQWLSGSALTESPGAFEPSTQGQAPWLGQTSHGQVAASELEVPSSQYMTPRLGDTASFSNAAVEAATNQLRQDIGTVIPTASRGTSGSAVPPSQAQLERAELFSLDLGNNSFDSYDTNFSDEMVINRSGSQSDTSETMSAFTGNMQYHGPIGPIAPARMNVAKVTSSENTGQTAADIVERILAKLSTTPLEKLECPFQGCQYRPTGKHRKNYRSHFERHLKKHDVNAIWRCPLPGCTQTIRGARKDNVQQHLERKHRNVTFETQESAGSLTLRRQPKRKVLQTSIQQQQQQQRRTGRNLRYGVSDNVRDQSGNTVSSDGDIWGGGGRGEGLATPDTLMGISGGNMTVERRNYGGGLPTGQDKEDILSQTGPGNMADRQWVIGHPAWTAGEEDQGASYLAGYIL